MEEEEERRKAPALSAVAGTIVWWFLGVRRRAAHESETASPVRILAAGAIGAAIFVAVLVALVRLIVANAG